MLRAFKPDTIIAVGGGSPMDAAKVMWLLYEHPEVNFSDLKEKFFDVRKRAFTFPKLGELAKLVCIPTTSGTGAEVTPFAVITDTETGRKYPLADYALTPTVAIVDPVLTASMPARVAADSGMDALTHATEAYVSVYANDFTDGMALQAIRLVFENIVESVNEGGTAVKAREKMHNAATIAGMAFGNAFLGLVHAMSHVTGSTLPRGPRPHQRRLPPARDPLQRQGANQADVVAQAGELRRSRALPGDRQDARPSVLHARRGRRGLRQRGRGPARAGWHRGLVPGDRHRRGGLHGHRSTRSR